MDGVRPLRKHRAALLHGSVACSVCGGTIAALGHDFSASVWHHDNYTHWKKCARCDAKNDENPHDWDSGNVTVPSSCLTEGERTYTCNECGVIKIEPIQANGHRWDQAWQYDAAHHWHECLNADCDVKDNDSAKEGYGAQIGGTATCTAEAICKYCHQYYGEKDPANHEGGTQQWTKSDRLHSRAKMELLRRRYRGERRSRVVGR